MRVLTVSSYDNEGLHQRQGFKKDSYAESFKKFSENEIVSEGGGGVRVGLIKA
jgi:hypothetical protein